MGQKSSPMFVRKAIKFLDNYLTKDMVVFEWGSGRSTQWLADRVKEIYSVEHQKKWFDIVSIYLKDRKNSNITFLEKENENYPKYILTLNKTFDVIVIDGRRRNECFKYAVKCLKPNGIILFDDIQRGRYKESRNVLQTWKNKEFVFEGDTGGHVRKITGIYYAN